MDIATVTTPTLISSELLVSILLVPLWQTVFFFPEVVSIIFVTGSQNVFVVGGYYRSLIFHTTVTYFAVLQLNILWNLCAFGKWRSKILKNNFPAFVFALRDYGGLCHIIFLFFYSLCWLFSSWFSVGVYFRETLYPFFFKAFDNKELIG